MHPDIKSLPAWSPHPYTQGEPPASLSKVDRRDRLQISSSLFRIFMWQIRLHVQKREDSAIEEEMPKKHPGCSEQSTRSSELGQPKPFDLPKKHNHPLCFGVIMFFSAYRLPSFASDDPPPHASGHQITTGSPRAKQP